MGHWIHFCPVLPHANNWPGMNGAACGVSYYCFESSLTDSHMLIFGGYDV
jgi:hypothetical protein